MRLNQFNAQRKQSLQVSTIPSTYRNSSLGKTISSREKRQNPFFIRKAKFIIQYIKQRSTSEQQHEIFQPQQSLQVSSKGIGGLMTSNHQSQPSAQVLPEGLRKISRNFSSIDSQKINRNSLMQAQLQKRKQAFLKSCGYLQNKNYTLAVAKQKRQTVQITPNVEQCNQRLFLDDIEAMKIERLLQQNFKPRKIRRTKRQKQLLNRTINQAERKLSQGQGKQTIQSVSFEKTKKILSGFNTKTTKSNINVDQVLGSLSRCSNKIYGKRHESDSITWCCEVLKAQLEEDEFQSYSSLVEKRKQQRQEKQSKSFTFRPIKRGLQQKLSLGNN